MKRKSKKLLALLLAFAMLMSLSFSAFAADGDDEDEDEDDAAVSYSNTSDPFTITNFSNVDVNVKVEVQFTGMTGVTFADNEDCKDADDEVIPDSMYLALLAEKTEAVAATEDAEDEEEEEEETTPTTTVLSAAGYAVVEDVIGKAAEGAYQWKVNEGDDGKEYAYELRDDLLEDADVASSTEFSKISIKMTGALSSKGWENFSGNPEYTITWTCFNEADNARVAYNWDDDEDEDTDAIPVYWDKVAKAFYNAETDGAVVSGLTAPDEDSDEIGADGLPVAAYLTAKHLVAVASTPASGVTVYESGSGSMTNSVIFEGSAPPETIDFDIPTAADNSFAFILDPNGRIEATEAEMYGGATFDYTKGNGLYFRNVATEGAGASKSVSATLTTAVDSGAVYAEVTIDFGNTAYNTVTKVTYSYNGVDYEKQVTEGASGSGTFTWDSETKTVGIKASTATKNATDVKIFVSDGENEKELPISLKASE